MKVKIKETGERTVLDYLREQSIHISAPCGGKGTCGKCKVKVNGSSTVMDASEKKLLGEKGIEEGYRLACKIPCEADMEIEVVDQEANFYVEVSYEQGEDKRIISVGPEDKYGIAIDIGTTTLAIEIVHLTTGQTLDIYTNLNSGRRYGADVISRIDYATQNGIQELQKVMQDDLLKGVEVLCHKHKVQHQSIEQMVIAGNTTMLHLLMGADCKGLGIYPFTPVFIDQVTLPIAKLLNKETFQGTASLMPGISTYVGADIVSGIFKCGMHEKSEVTMLIDIGTNGEMVIGNKERLLSLATAAGPAFEGGNMSCGTGSIQGAICGATYAKGKFQVQTIGNAEPVGICGSGLIDLISESLSHELMDETGLVEEDIIEIVKEKNIALTQEDVRHFQLAKAAIRAGVELLMKNYGIKAKEVATIYLAGGFGKFINLDNAFLIGLLPMEFEGKVKRVGNASLGGAKKHLVGGAGKESDGLGVIQKMSGDLNLANDPTFNAYFVEYMLFGEE